jgi:hypothetical protein
MSPPLLQIRVPSVLENVHAFGTQVPALRPSVKGAAARLAALGPDGPPLTAGLRPAAWQ